MRRVVLLVAILALVTWTAAPAYATPDAKDWVQSPGSETVEAAKSFADWIEDTLGSPMGLSLGTVSGDGTQAWLMCADSDWSFETGLALVPKVTGAGSVGLRIESKPNGSSDLGATVGLALSLFNIKGTELRLAAKTVSGQISPDYVDLGPLGRFHYAYMLDVTFPTS